MTISAFDRLAACFPNPEDAPPDEPLCYGGNLEPQTLLCAYSRGIFPWFSKGEPILWWSPDPRCILLPADFHLPRSSARKIGAFSITMNSAFDKVIGACAAIPRPGQHGTWITPAMRKAYTFLHRLGYAHSIEAWWDSRLVGGLYGVILGKAFFGESMFHLEAEASRAALNALVILMRQLDFTFIDCQQETPHMLRMGAKSVPRTVFLHKLAEAQATRDNCAEMNGICPWKPFAGKWLFDGQQWHRG